jgi:hypothetical protein
MKTIVTLSILFLSRSIFATSGTDFDYDKILKQYTFLTPTQINEKWGASKVKDFDFKKADIKKRAELTYGIVTNKSLIHNDRQAIVNMFGEPDTYFFSEQNVSYLISKDVTTNERWALVFLINSDQKLEQIRVAKTCCYLK